MKASGNRSLTVAARKRSTCVQVRERCLRLSTVRRFIVEVLVPRRRSDNRRLDCTSISWGAARTHECRVDMPYYSQVSSRFAARLLAALLFALTAFGAAAPSAASISQPAIGTRQKARRASQRLPEQHKSAFTPRLVRVTNSRGDSPLPTLSFLSWLFQRPPPAALLLDA
jgi:hypothetical protein